MPPKHYLLLFTLFSCVLPDRILAESALGLTDTLTRAARSNDLPGLDPLSRFHDRHAATLVLSLIDDPKVPDAAWQRLCDLVRSWPATSEGRKTLRDYLAAHLDCPPRALRFFAQLQDSNLHPLFWKIIEKSSAAKNPKSPSSERLAAAVAGFSGKMPDSEVTRLASFLASNHSYIVRASTAHSLGAVSSPLAIPSLIEHLADPALGDRARAALYRLTAQDFGEDPAAWQTWWKANATGFQPRMLGLEAWHAHAKTNPLPAPTSASFYNLPFKARHALFMLDVSASMAGPRLEKLKEQMQTLLTSLESGPVQTRFEILTFCNLVELCAGPPQLLAPNRNDLRDASEFVQRLRPIGGTAMVDAFVTAQNKVLPMGNIDTIYFLSDGTPTDGSPDDVLEVVARLHRQYHVRIHTIHLAGGEKLAPPSSRKKHPPLLEQIASRTGGTYVRP